MHSWSIFGAQTNHGRLHKLTKLITAQTWRKPPPSPNSILCAWLEGQHPNVIFSWDSEVGVLKFPKLGLL